jgi:hypothetical protein
VTQEAKGRVTNVDFYEVANLPPQLARAARSQKANLGQGIVAVRTRIGSEPTYEFMPVGSRPKDIKKFMAELAASDGVDLNEAVKRAFAD